MKHNRRIDEAVAAVREVFRDVDARPIERNCNLRRECCHFRLTGRTPHLTRGEAFTAAKALRATGRKHLPAKSDGSCPLLDTNGHCMIYADRPFGCRTHFCAAAGGSLARHEVADLVQRLEQIDRELGGNGSHAIEESVRNALAELR